MGTPSTTASDFDSFRAKSIRADVVHLSNRDLRHFTSSLRAVTAVAALALAAGLAFAATASADRSYVCQITAKSSPSASECNGSGNTVPGGAFGTPRGLAVDSSGNVWVTDTASGRISKFDSAGNYLAQATGATSYGGGAYIESATWNNAAGKLFVSDSNGDDVWGFNSDGTYAGLDYSGLGGGCCYLRVAADNSGGAANGDLYVSGPSNSVVRLTSSGSAHTFSASAAYISANTLTGSPEGPFPGFSGSGGNVAVDGSGDVYIATSGGKVSKFHSTGEFAQTFNGAGAPGALGAIPGIAIDPTSGNLLVIASSNMVYEFDSTGAYVGQITGISPAEPFGTLRSIAVDENGFLYVSDSSSQVINKFSPGVILPAITPGSPSNAGHTSVTLNAGVDTHGGGDVTSCHFEYGTSATYSSGTLPCLDGSNTVVGNPGSPITALTQVHADLTGLTPETRYHYRLVASNDSPNGTAKTADNTFKPDAVLGASTDASSGGVTGSQTLNGSFTGEGIATSYYFEYVLDSAYDPLAVNPYASGSATASPPGVPASIGTGSQSVSAPVSVTSFTEYHYRAVFTNSFGTTYGPDRTFVSAPPAMPTVGPTTASNVSSVGATLGAAVNPGFGATVVRFDYGTSPAYGSRSYPTDSIGSDGVSHPVSVGVTELTPRTTYHFRALATNWTGTTYGPDQVFTTPDVPIVENSRQVAATASSASVAANVRPGFRPTNVHVEFGRTSLYGSSPHGSISVGADDSPHNVEIGLDGLEPETTYHFRIVAENSVGYTVGSDAIVTTGKQRVAESAPPPRCKKSQVKKGGRCVKKKRRSRKRHHKSSHRPIKAADRHSHVG